MTRSTVRVPAAVEAVRAAAELTNPAFITLLGEDEVAAAAASAPPGPLHGTPFAVKDNIDVAGVVSTVAFPPLAAPPLGGPAARSATAVQRLVAAGAVAIGKTNLDQFATGLVGTRSPYGACHCVDSPAHVSGGSSSGSAVAVAAGVVPFALATDTAGSGRVPAAFNGLVGIKPTRGLISTRGVFPAAPSLDCVAVLSRTLSLGRTVVDLCIGYDAEDPWSRPMPVVAPPGVARVMSVVGVPDVAALDLDPAYREVWPSAVDRLRAVAEVRTIDVSPLLAVARMLYETPFVAERLASFGHLLLDDHPDLDPAVRQIVLGARDLRADALYAAQHRLQALARTVRELYADLDAIMLPTAPGHPSLVEVAADPVGANRRLGTYTNMVNLLDLCAVAVPAARAGALPFGVQLMAPAFADHPLLDLAARMLAEHRSVEPPEPAEQPLDEARPDEPARTLLAVCGLHMSGEPLNGLLVGGGAWLHTRARTAGGYRMVCLDAPARPGLLADAGGPPGGLELEVWDAPVELVERLRAEVVAPLRIEAVRLADGSAVPGFVADPFLAAAAQDITAAGGWRHHLRAAAAG